MNQVTRWLGTVCRVDMDISFAEFSLEQLVKWKLSTYGSGTILFDIPRLLNIILLYYAFVEFNTYVTL
jgi:ABC-type arginine transport system permease subunit